MFSRSSLSRALGIRPGARVSVLNPPNGFVQRLNPLPDGVEFLVTARTGLDVILFFPSDPHDLVERLPALSRAMAVTGGIWICWPRHSRGRLSEELIRLAGLDVGLVDDKYWDLDETWSALRLVWQRRGDRLDKPARTFADVAEA